MTPAQTARHSHRIADIEVLRGVAILMVIVWHYDTAYQTPAILPAFLAPWIHWAIGVDLFFAISGFVIARSLLPTLDSAKSLKSRVKTVMAFLTRRIFRLFPSVWFWLLFILFCVLIFQRDALWGSLETNLRASLSVVLHYANYRFATIWGVAPLGTSFPYWSLSLEEQFYIGLPLLALVLIKKRFLAAALTAIIIAQFIYERESVAIIFRCEGLTLGVLLAIAHQAGVVQRFEPALMRHIMVRIPALVLLIALLSALMSPSMRDLLNISHSRAYNFVAIISIMLVYIGSFDRGYIVPPGRFQNMLTWIGARSYAMYLCHIPCLYLAVEIVWRLFPDHAPAYAKGWTIIILGAGLTAFFSNFNFKYIEKPLNQYGRRVSKIITGESANAGPAQKADESLSRQTNGVQ
jgi:peptidoglycan/LPS O-acetylase OafA/YrhL